MSSGFKITLNKDKELVKTIRQAVKDNGGYCPCQLERNKDTKCMCKGFIEQEHGGYCHCELYYKEISEDIKYESAR